MFKVLSLPATFGDCFWIQYGDEQDPNHILIDGGTGGTRNHIENALRQMPKDRRHFELVVDSTLEGVRKPDPEIFKRALERMAVEPDAALYAGDIPTAAGR